jgi:hypothetical protein
MTKGCCKRDISFMHWDAVIFGLKARGCTAEQTTDYLWRSGIRAGDGSNVEVKKSAAVTRLRAVVDHMLTAHRPMRNNWLRKSWEDSQR